MKRLSIACCSLIPSLIMAADLYVSPTGNDANPGTQSKPIASLGRAVEKVRAGAGKTPVTVYFADGIYYLPETVVFTAQDSGTAKNPVVYKAIHEGKAVLSGGSRLDLKWTPYRDGIYRAKTPAGLAIDQLFIQGKNQRMARYPNYDASKKEEPYQGFAADAFSKERARRWKDPRGGYIHALHSRQWGGYHYRITGKDAAGKVTYEGGWQNNRQMGMHKQYRMVENIFEELDAPGEWFHDAKDSTLYYMPDVRLRLEQKNIEQGISNIEGAELSEREIAEWLATATVEVVRLRHLVEFEGSEKDPVRYISLQGFTVRHAARTFMDCKEPLVRSDWTIYRGGAFMLTGTEDVSMVDCEFDQVGGNAIFVNNYNRRTRVKGCHIHDTGASGICFVGDPNALRDPLFEYKETNDLYKIDRTPGPKTATYPSLGIVEDCLIHGIGRVERQPAGVEITMSSQITVRDCSIYDCARAGINIGDGAFGGHLIDGCDVFDTVLETHDHGSFNSWGRDRFWHADRSVSQNAVDKDPALPFLDAVKTTTIRNSRWRCDHGWDIDLDDGSTNYDIYNNLMLGKGLKLREGFRRHAWNNVIPFGSLHPHVWYKGSKDQVYSNIFAAGHRWALMRGKYLDGTMVDRNLFISQDRNILKKSSKYGWDGNSQLGDPMFINPEQGDFRVKDDSPALKLGFKNFPMDRFGVKKASLKALAETPVIPTQPPGDATAHPSAPAGSMKTAWQGAVLKNLEGEEFSAYGVSKSDGGIALVDRADSSAVAKAGLKVGDLILGVNGQSTRNTAEFLTAVMKHGSSPVKLKVMRTQKVAMVDVVPGAVIKVEQSDTADGFSTLPMPGPSNWAISANPKAGNEPATSLLDGRLAKSYGPIFSNGIPSGMYKIDLGKSQQVRALTSWAYNRGGSRGAQKLTLYASNATTDPGWDLSTYSPLGSIDTGSVKSTFSAASLQAVNGKSLGSYRWIVWSVSPANDRSGGEHTAFQELSIEVVK